VCVLKIQLIYPFEACECRSVLEIIMHIFSHNYAYFLINAFLPQHKCSIKKTVRVTLAIDLLSIVNLFTLSIDYDYVLHDYLLHPL